MGKIIRVYEEDATFALSVADQMASHYDYLYPGGKYAYFIPKSETAYIEILKGFSHYKVLYVSYDMNHDIKDQISKWERTLEQGIKAQEKTLQNSLDYAIHTKNYFKKGETNHDKETG